MINENLSRSSEMVKLLRLITEMLDASEKRGNGGIIPLTSFIKGQNLKINVQNFAVDTIENPEIPNKL